MKKLQQDTETSSDNKNKGYLYVGECEVTDRETLLRKHTVASSVLAQPREVENISEKCSVSSDIRQAVSSVTSNMNQYVGQKRAMFVEIASDENTDKKMSGIEQTAATTPQPMKKPKVTLTDASVASGSSAKVLETAPQNRTLNLASEVSKKIARACLRYKKQLSSYVTTEGIERTLVVKHGRNHWREYAHRFFLDASTDNQLERQYFDALDQQFMFTREQREDIYVKVEWLTPQGSIKAWKNMGTGNFATTDEREKLPHGGASGLGSLVIVRRTGLFVVYRLMPQITAAFIERFEQKQSLLGGSNSSSVEVFVRLADQFDSRKQRVSLDEAAQMLLDLRSGHTARRKNPPVPAVEAPVAIMSGVSANSSTLVMPSLLKAKPVEEEADSLADVVDEVDIKKQQTAKYVAVPTFISPSAYAMPTYYKSTPESRAFLVQLVRRRQAERREQQNTPPIQVIDHGLIKAYSNKKHGA